MSFSEFKFDDPRYLAIAFACLPLYFLARYWSASAWKKLRLFAGKSRDPLSRNGRRFDRRTTLALAAILCFALAMARPQADPEVEEREGQALDIIVLLDVSRSMAAEDLYPNRLGKAKRTISTMLSRLSGDRVGLVAFAGSAVLVSPLTSDYEIIRTFLFALNTDTVENQGTNIGAAMRVALDAFRRGSEREIKQEEKSHVLLLLSDGEMTAGETDEALGELKKFGITMHAVAVGGEKGAPIPIRDKNGVLVSFKQDRRGNPVLSTVDFATLEKLARATNGAFFRASPDDSEVAGIVDGLAALNRAPTKNQKSRIYREYFHIPLAVGLLLLILSYLPPLGRLRAISAFALLALFPAAGARAQEESQQRAQAEAKAAAPTAGEKVMAALGNDQRKKSLTGSQLFKQERYGEAVEIYKGLQAEDPSSPELGYNTGTAMIRDGKAAEARALLQETAESLGRDNPVGALASYNLAGSYAENKEYGKAMEEYASLVQRLSEKDKLTKTEEVVLAEARKRLEQSSQKQEQQQQKDKDDKKKQEDQDEKKDENKKEKGSDNNSKSDESQSKDQESQEKDKDNQNGEEDKQKPKDEKFDFKKKKKFKENEVLSERDAKRMLEALKQQEQLLQKKLLQQKTISRQQPNPNDKDW